MSRLLKREDRFSIKINHQIQLGQQSRIEVYFLLPKEMGIGPKTLAEETYFTSGISSKHSYFTSGLRLPLVRSRFTTRMDASSQQYRHNINLFAYQYISALELDYEAVLQESDNEDFYLLCLAVVEQSSELLQTFRRNRPENDKYRVHFENVDNYLSWSSEQAILKLVAYRPKSSASMATRTQMLDWCQQEADHRETQSYNSPDTNKDPNRLANKMRLIRRLIEHGVVFQPKIAPLGRGSKKVMTGIATALIMVVMLSLIIQAQGVFDGITWLLVLVLAVIYGFREVFKDDLKTMLWRWISRGKPKWQRNLFDGQSKLKVATERVWLDYIKQAQLPQAVIDHLSHRHIQNKQSSEILAYRTSIRVSNKGFQPGYEAIQENLIFNFRPFARYLEKGSDQLFTLNGGKVSREAIERRYQVNVIVGIKSADQACNYVRYKVTLDRSKIIDVEEAKAIG